MAAYATLEDLETLWRPLDEDEKERAQALLDLVSDSLRYEAEKLNKDLDAMIEESPALATVAKSVTVDIVARTLMTSTREEPMSQMTQSALGYSFSGTFLNPGGGLFIKRSELARLGLKRQRYGAMEIYDPWNNRNTDRED